MKAILNTLLVSFIACTPPSLLAEPSSDNAPKDDQFEISEKLIKTCLEIWQSRLTNGYTAVGNEYGISTDQSRKRLMIEGVAVADTGQTYPYNYVCTLNDDLSLDRLVTYFAIRFDEQAHTLTNPKGVFGNPVLPRLAEEFK